MGVGVIVVVMVDGPTDSQNCGGGALEAGSDDVGVAGIVYVVIEGPSVIVPTGSQYWGGGAQAIGGIPGEILVGPHCGGE